MKHLEEIKQIENEIFKASFDNLDNYHLLIEEDNELKGYLLYSKVLDEAEIISIYVKEKYRNNKIASKLINLLQSKVNYIYLEVNENNVIAYHLYNKLGFIEYGRRKKYYGNDDAIMMKWSCEDVSFRC